MERGYVQVATAEEVTSVAPFVRVDVEGEPLLLARLDDGTVRAFGARCPHLGQPLSDGELTGSTLECRSHYYAYDLDTGRNTGPGGGTDVRLGIHDVVEHDGAVYVRLRDPDA